MGDHAGSDPDSAEKSTDLLCHTTAFVGDDGTFQARPRRCLFMIQSLREPPCFLRLSHGYPGQEQGMIRRTQPKTKGEPNTSILDREKSVEWRLLGSPTLLLEE
jgi:hypothetical protein